MRGRWKERKNKRKFKRKKERKKEKQKLYPNRNYVRKNKIK